MIERTTERMPDAVVDAFHGYYYDSAEHGGTWKNTFWLGVATEKCPLDLWIYQEMLHELKPDLIVETGTRWGGSALFLASMCDLIGNGRIITIDVDVPGKRPTHDRIEYLMGSSTSAPITENVREHAESAASVLVVLDSDHSRDHVMDELRAYAPLVTTGSYVVVEDTNVNGNPVLPHFGPGPMEAVDEFLRETEDFVIDREREKLLLTFNPRGFLRRLRG
ncbi:MAG: CmcI family methyltransferase [Actinomycetota bacterium]